MWAFYVPQLWPCQIGAGHTVDTWDWNREFNQSLVFLKTWSSSSDFTQHQFLCSSHHEFTHGSADIVQSFTAYENINLYISISRLLWYGFAFRQQELRRACCGCALSQPPRVSCTLSASCWNFQNSVSITRSLCPALGLGGRQWSRRFEGCPTVCKTDFVQFS